jgi:hypothetical protein
MFGRNDTPETRGAKKQSTLGFFFNPRIGASASALGESFQMLVRLIALIFSQFGLIDRRHPIITGQDRGKKSLFEVVGLAYERVHWKQENLLPNMIFLAVCSCIGLAALSLVYVVFTLLFSFGAAPQPR